MVALAVLLVVAGAAVSPQGGPRHARPPDTLWSAPVDAGRAPGLWVLGGYLVLAEADGLRALDPDAGEQVWQTPLDDPACTPDGDTLVCVAGTGQDAAVVTVDASGTTTEEPFPHAAVAARIGTDLVVAGGTTEQQPWLVRIPAAGGEPVWRLEPELPFGAGVRFTGITVDQGVVTVRTVPGEADGEVELAFAADAVSGVPRTAVVNYMGVTTFSSPDDDPTERPLLPLGGEELEVAGHPHAAFSLAGLVDLETGSVLREGDALPLYSLGADVLGIGMDPWDGQGPLPDFWLQRAHALSGQQRWRLPTEQRFGCPCTRTEHNVVLTGTMIDRELFRLLPGDLAGVDVRTGQLRWSQPLDSVPHGLAATGDQVFLLAAGTLTAYADR